MRNCDCVAGGQFEVTQIEGVFMLLSAWPNEIEGIEMPVFVAIHGESGVGAIRDNTCTSA